MLEENKKPEKEVKKAPEELVKNEETIKHFPLIKVKDYTFIKSFTNHRVNNPGDTITVEVGSDLENYLVTNKFVNKHGISRPN